MYNKDFNTKLNTSANILNSMIYLQYIHGLQTFQWPKLSPSSVLKEHATRDYSNVYKHAQLTKHVINFLSPEILAHDTLALRLQVKETLYIREHEAYKSLNGNLGSLNLLLW